VPPPINIGGGTAGETALMKSSTLAQITQIILSFLLGAGLFFFAVSQSLAEELTVPQTPAPSPTTEPVEHIEASQSELTESESTAITPSSPAPAADFHDTAIPTQTNDLTLPSSLELENENTVPDEQVIISPLSTTLLQTTLLQTNTSTATIAATQEAATGGNDLQTNTSASLQTGTASAVIAVQQEHNTTLIGTDGQFNTTTIDHPSSGDVDLRGSPPDQLNSQNTAAATVDNTAITVANEANLSNTLDQAVQTGDNSLALTGQPADNPLLATGDAIATVALLTTANTTLIGNCFRFDITTILAPVQGNLLLPNEEDYLYCHQPDISPSSVAIANTVETVNDISTDTDTGQNSGDGSVSIATGTAASESTIIERLNETWLGNQWALLRIFNPTLLSNLPSLPNATSYQSGNTLYYWWKPFGQPVNSQSDLAIEITNDAQLFNSISQLAHTGNNQLTNPFATAATIETGNALTSAAILNYLNTTVIGSNWYLSDVNLLAPVEGTITTAKPDLRVEALASATQLYAGDEVTLSFLVQNVGTSRSQPASFVVTVPSGLTVVAVGEGGSVDGQTVLWQIPALNEGSALIISLRLRADHTSSGITQISGSARYALTELETNNNSASIALALAVRPAATVRHLAQVPVQTIVYQTTQTIPRYRMQPTIRYVNQQLASRPRTAEQSQILGTSTSVGDALQSLIPAVSAANGTTRLSYCATHLAFCQGLRFGFWSIIGLGLTSAAYRRIRPRFNQSNPPPIPRVF